MQAVKRAKPGGRKFRVREMSSRALMGYVFILPALVMLTALVIYPLLYGVYISFFNTNLANKWNPVGISHYINLFKDWTFVNQIGLTLKFTLIVVAAHFVIGTLLALQLNKPRRGVTFFRTVLTLPWLFPEVVIALLFKWIFNPLYGIWNDFLFRLGLISDNISWLGSAQYAFVMVCVVCIWKGFPLVMINVLAGLQSISQDLYEAATIDGANRWQSFTHITVPSIRPVLLTTLVLDTVWWFKHYTIVWLLTQGGPGNATSIVSINIYKEAFDYFNFGKAAAMSVIIFIICYLISILYRRLFDHDQ